MPEPEDFEATKPAVPAHAGISGTAAAEAEPVRSSEQEESNPEPGPTPDQAAEPGPAVAAEKPTPSGPALPPLSPQEFRIYNRLAEQMDYFHDHFRQTWHTLYAACTSGRRPAGMTPKQFLDEGLRLARYLETHHAIEETHLYPLLARKMPEFRAAPKSSGGGKGGGRGDKGKQQQQDCELLRQHREIHDGMDGFAEYLRKCKARECELELGVLKEKMDSWGEVLFRHLDQEVAELGAEKMRRYWTLAEMRAFPI